MPEKKNCKLTGKQVFESFGIEKRSKACFGTDGKPRREYIDHRSIRSPSFLDVIAEINHRKVQEHRIEDKLWPEKKLPDTSAEIWGESSVDLFRH